jgi:hypothetical protein
VRWTTRGPPRSRRDQALVLELRRAWGTPSRGWGASPAGALGDLLDDLVAVPRLLRDQARTRAGCHRGRCAARTAAARAGEPRRRGRRSRSERGTNPGPTASGGPTRRRRGGAPGPVRAGSSFDGRRTGGGRASGRHRRAANVVAAEAAGGTARGPSSNRESMLFMGVSFSREPGAR